jgi:hypothetical protein
MTSRYSTTDQHLAQLQELYLKRFGTEIDREEARQLGEKIIRLTRLVYR